MADSKNAKEDDDYTEEEASQRFEKTVGRMLKTPPKPHKPKKSEERETE